MKYILLSLIFVFFINTGLAIEFKNPYVNKNIESHFSEFITYEFLAEFHEGIKNYNIERKKLPEIKFINNYYIMKENNNTLKFNVNFALKGEFFYNDKISNIKDLKKISTVNVLINFLIQDVMASEVQVSNILTAALWKLIPLSTRALAFTGIRQNQAIKDSLKIYQQACEHLPSDSIILPGKSKDQEMMNNLFNQMAENKNNEASIVNEALGINDPNCMKNSKTNLAPLQYGSGFSDITANQNGSRTNANFCSELRKLEECISNLYSANINDKTRSFIKDKVDSESDDLKDYSSSVESK